MDEDELLHYGVLGMKWGKGTRGKSPSNSKKKSKTESNNIKKMSDDELRKAVNRLQLEQQYSKLNPKTIDKGKNYAQKVFKAGTTVAGVTTTGLTIYNNVDKIKKIITKS